MFFRSVRFKFLVWYIIFLTLTLLAFSLILYGTFHKALYDDLDDLLVSRAEGVANSINTYWQARKMLIAQDGKDSAYHIGSFTELAREWVEEKRKDPDLMSIFVRILDPRGSCLVASKAMPRIEAIPEEDFKDVVNMDEEDSFDTVKGEPLGGKKTRFRIYTRPVTRDGRVEYVVQVAGPIGLVSLALNNLMFVLFVLLPLTVLLAGVPGVLLAGMTLHPVDKMINTLRQITAENLKLKIHIPDTKDEIKRLADTFNNMIERLDRSFSSQRRFIQELSHELKAPMDVLKKELEASLQDLPSEKEFRPILTRTLKEIDAFSQIIEDLLAFSNFDDGRTALEIRKMNLTALAEKALAVMRPQAEEKEINVSLYSPGNVVLDGDREQIRQMIMNLVDNAIKYTYRNGAIAVTILKDDKYARIVISDTGAGIPEADIEYIFDRFYQSPRPRAGARGFGLGLSIVKAIVEEHKGDIKVESRPGKGSTFTVSLPLSYPV